MGAGEVGFRFVDRRGLRLEDGICIERVDDLRHGIGVNLVDRLSVLPLGHDAVLEERETVFEYRVAIVCFIRRGPGGAVRCA